MKQNRFKRREILTELGRAIVMMLGVLVIFTIYVIATT
jgi:hypothetical protein